VSQSHWRDSPICGQVKQEWQAWSERRLDEVVLDCLFPDASFFRMLPGSSAEPVLAAWGIAASGKPASRRPARGGWPRTRESALVRAPAGHPAGATATP
jgi:hypothetical protein